MKRYLGVDLHKDKFTVCYLDQQDKKVIREFRLENLDRFKKTLKPEDEIAVEAVANSRYFCEELVTLVEKVVMVAPGKFKVISDSSNKTDPNDAANLAEFLKLGKLPEARIMNKQQALIKSLLNTRNKFVKQRTQCKNKIHNILNSHGINIKSPLLFTKKGLESLKKMDFEPLVKKEIELLVRHVAMLNESIAEIEEELKRPENQLPGHQNLTSITGIGNVSASILLCAIGDIGDFPHKKKMNAYFGLVPSVRISNNTVHYGRITKRGNRLMRATLVQCTLVMIRYNPILRDFYLRLKQHKGSGKAIVATSRKLLEFVHFTLVENIIWEDSNHGVIKI